MNANNISNIFGAIAGFPQIAEGIQAIANDDLAHGIAKIAEGVGILVVAYFVGKPVQMMVLLFVLTPMLSFAATATWQNDTVADFAGTHIYRAPGTCATPGAFTKINTFPKPATSGVLINPVTDGVFCHKATAFDTAGNESVFSNTAEHIYNVVPPKAPALLDVID